MSLSNYFAHTSSTLSLRPTTIDLRLRVEAHAQRRQMTRRRSRKRDRDEDKETKKIPKDINGKWKWFLGHTQLVRSVGRLHENGSFGTQQTITRQFSWNKGPARERAGQVVKPPLCHYRFNYIINKGNQWRGAELSRETRQSRARSLTIWQANWSTDTHAQRPGPSQFSIKGSWTPVRRSPSKSTEIASRRKKKLKNNNNINWHNIGDKATTTAATTKLYTGHSSAETTCTSKVELIGAHMFWQPVKARLEWLQRCAAKGSLTFDKKTFLNTKECKKIRKYIKYLTCLLSTLLE